MYFRATYCTAHIVTAPDTNAETNCNDNGDDDDTVFWLIVVFRFVSSVRSNHAMAFLVVKFEMFRACVVPGPNGNGAVLKPPT